MTVTRVLRLFLLILAELCLAVGGTAEPVYGLIGKEVRLDPKVTGALSSITWKKGKDKIAEWDQKLGHDYYDRCKTEGQCDLSNSTGVLIMKGLNPEDDGRYFAEINSKGPAKTFQLIVLEPVSKPIVTASCNETQCTLTCVGQETKHTRYSWKENDETVKEGDTLMVEKSGDHSKSYTCVISNPKSEEEGDPLTEMDLFPGPTVTPWVVAILSVLLVIAVAVAVYFWHKARAVPGWIPCCTKFSGGQNEQDPDGEVGMTPLREVKSTDTENTQNAQNAGGQAEQEGDPLLNHNSGPEDTQRSSGQSAEGLDPPIDGDNCYNQDEEDQHTGAKSADTTDSQETAPVHSTQMESGPKGGETEDTADNQSSGQFNTGVQENVPQDLNPRQEMNQEVSEEGGGDTTLL